MRTIWAIARKDITLLARDKTAFFFTFAFPVIFAVIFGFFFSGSVGSKVKLIVVDNDRTTGSKAFIKALEKSGQVSISFATEAAAKRAVLKGTTPVYLVLPKAFGLYQRLAPLGMSPRVILGIDPSRKATGAMVRGLVMQVAGEQLSSSFMDPARAGSEMSALLKDLPADLKLSSTERARLQKNGVLFARMLQFVPSDFPLFNLQPVRIDSPSISNAKSHATNAFSVSFPQGILWGILSCLITFAVSLIHEKTRGTMVRLHTAPIGRYQIIGGKALASFIINLVIIFVLIALGAMAFKVRPHSIPLFLFSAVSVALGFTGIMIFVSVLAKTERSAESMAWAVMMILAMSGGAMIPLFFMPDWMLTVSNFSPVKWGIVSLEGVLWRGYGFQDLLLPNGVVLAVGSLFFLAGLWVYRKREAL